MLYKEDFIGLCVSWLLDSFVVVVFESLYEGVKGL